MIDSLHSGFAAFEILYQVDNSYFDNYYRLQRLLLSVFSAYSMENDITTNYKMRRYGSSPPEHGEVFQLLYCTLLYCTVVEGLHKIYVRHQ